MRKVISLAVVLFISTGCSNVEQLDKKKYENMSTTHNIECPPFERDILKGDVDFYQVIFRGTVSKIEVSKHPGLEENACWVTFNVKKLWKGKKQNQYLAKLIYLPRVNYKKKDFGDSKSCPYQVGEEYLIYSQPDTTLPEKFLVIEESCGPSKLWSKAAKDVRFINKTLNN